ncbi:hypothetical protein [Inquilinus limosus]|uniref:Uncharacterized protein n=1 Tax=Inquilinus limosus TaxID=171674 RepID=A0A211ZE86_9PROT|nr:hypothetical protein [Inquilinus limosus]OWJ63608.1 hypothetical protein BWR60_28630 [Inquilinus limosus]
MTDSRDNGLLWIAQRYGQEWCDEDVQAAVGWLVSLVPGSEWRPRAAAVEARFQAAKANWADGRRVPLFEPADAVAWYVHQASRYADPLLRPDFFLPEGFRIAPLFRRIGQLLPTLRTIEGAEARAARLMTENTSQPDDGIYELLVAGAYARRGWSTVRFVPEAPGIEKRPDLLVDRRRSSWAVECKRAGRSGYARDERLAGERMAEGAHALSRSVNRPLVILVRFTEELHLLEKKYLAGKVERFLDTKVPYEWKDEGGQGVVMDVIWSALHSVMVHDDIYFGSSRMAELLLGRYDQMMDFSMAGDWTPAQGRPLHATWVDHVSLVAWRSTSDEAARRKAMHFRGLVARASAQLPGDRPGAIHVGYEAVGGNSEDGRRHQLNRREMRTFDPAITGLRMVYGNYFMNELVTSRNESAAVTETLAWYPVGSARSLHPLPGHMLFMDENGKPGSHL